MGLLLAFLFWSSTFSLARRISAGNMLDLQLSGSRLTRRVHERVFIFRDHIGVGHSVSKPDSFLYRKRTTS